MKESDLSRFMYSRPGTLLLALLALVGVLAAYASGDLVLTGNNSGIAYPSVNLWFGSDTQLSLMVSVACYLGMCGGMAWSTAHFNFLRSPDKTFVSLFLLFTAATPSLMASMNGGTLTAMVVLGCMLLLFSTFDNPVAPYRIYLIFLALSAASLIQYSVLPYILLFVVGMAQMRTFNTRSVMAALLGTITPIWIICGLGIKEFDAFNWPEIRSIFGVIDLGEAAALLFTVVVTLALAIIAWLLNLMKTLTYNAPTRAMNGFITLLTIGTPLMMMIDYANFTTYIPVLNMCAAYQVGHTLSASYGQRSYIPLASIIIIYALLYAWRMAI